MPAGGGVMRVLVCGGRCFDDEGLVETTLNDLGVTHIIEGGATGADMLACKWARANLGGGSEHISQFKARWDAYGKAAGPIRNQEMLDKGKPDLVVAFAGGRGTADMVRRAKRVGIPVKEVR